MAYKIEFDMEAYEVYSKLDGSVKKQIEKYIEKLEKRDNPRTLGEQLKDNLSAFWKYRVGNYRLIAEIQDDKLIILMLITANAAMYIK